MKDVNTLYHNDFGIAFRWKNIPERLHMVQLVFRDTGFLLDKKSIQKFANQIHKSMGSQNSACGQCDLNRSCRSILLETPMEHLTMAISLDELDQLNDLVQGTLFQLELEHYLAQLSLN